MMSKNKSVVKSENNRKIPTPRAGQIKNNPEIAQMPVMRDVKAGAPKGESGRCIRFTREKE